MSFYRIMDRSMWGDERVQAVGAIARSVFGYLCHNEQDDLCGLYRLSLGQAEEDTGWTREQLAGALSELEREGLAHYDEGVRVVWVVNMLVKQGRKKDGGVAAKCITHTVRQLEHLPRTALKEKMVAYYAELGVEIPYLKPAATRDTPPIPHRYPTDTPSGIVQDGGSDTLSAPDGEGEIGVPRARARASASASGSDSGSEESSLAERQRRAASIPMLDPLAAAHDPDVVALLGIEPPVGCRPWGPTDAGEVHRQVRACGLGRVHQVVQFVREAIEGRRRFGDVSAHPKHWSALWKYDGDAWDRWHARFCEARVRAPPPEEISDEDLVREEAERSGLSPAVVAELVAKVAKGKQHD